MGMYTELVLATKVKNDPAIVPILQFMADPQPVTPMAGLPEHPLFKTPRWQFLFSCSSYYFVPRSVCKFEYDEIGKYWVLISRADLKNYDDEIAKFIDWIEPYLDVEPGEMIGYSRYEETAEPTIIYAKGEFT